MGTPAQAPARKRCIGKTPEFFTAEFVVFTVFQSETTR
jgi:hypothetical protein